MNNFGNKLKLLRDLKKYSAKEVVQKLQASGFEIADKTLYGYEKGIRMPNADIFVELCKIYKCHNILETFSETGIDYSIPNDLKYPIIEKYRDLDDHGKEMVNLVLDKESDRMADEYIEVAARGGKYKLKKTDVIELANRINSEPYEEDHDLC